MERMGRAGLCLMVHMIVACVFSAHAAIAGDGQVPSGKELAPRRCTFDAQGRFMVDGRPFLPIGIYCLGVDKEDMDIIAGSPFNCVMPYRRPSRGELDLCEERGIKVIYDVRGKLTDAYSDEEGLAWIRETLPKVMKHPAIMAWYADDESPVARIPRLIARKQLLNEMDPDHPVWAVQDKWKRVGEFVGTFDVFGTDPYPVSKEPIGNVAKAVRLSRSATSGRFPVWQVIQGFRWNEKFRSGELMPTATEFRNMTWQAVAEGADGLVYFRYHQLREKTKPGAQEWWREAWPAISAAAAEVKKYERLFLSAAKGPAVSGAPEGLSVRSWLDDGVTHVLCVNSTTNRLDCTVEVEKMGGGGLSVDFADESAVRRTEGGSFAISLPALGYAILHSQYP